MVVVVERGSKATGGGPGDLPRLRAVSLFAAATPPALHVSTAPDPLTPVGGCDGSMEATAVCREEGGGDVERRWEEVVEEEVVVVVLGGRCCAGWRNRCAPLGARRSELASGLGGAVHNLEGDVLLPQSPLLLPQGNR